MHRIMLPDGTHRQSKSLRLARSFGYASLGLAGVMIILSNVLTDLLSSVLAVFLVVGGFSSAVGAALRRWLGEFVGLPLSAAALVSLGLITYDDTKDAAPLLALGNLLLLIGYALLLGGRWRAVLSVYRLARWLVSKEDSQ